MLLEAPPPLRHISSTPISLGSASTMLDKYMENSETYAHLHPDAMITPEGVTFNAQGGALGNPLMHHLRRVAAGLRGEYLEPDLSLEDIDDDQQNATADITVTTGGKKLGKKSKAAGEEDWQSMSEYQAEQGGIEIGDVGDRTYVVQQGGEEPAVQVTGSKGKESKKRKEQADDAQAGANGHMDKAARKKAKKERDAQRKRDKAAAAAQSNKSD